MISSTYEQSLLSRDARLEPLLQRFSALSRVLPFLPVFGGGTSKFQPVFVGDIAAAVEIATREDANIRKEVGGQIFEAGGPDGKGMTPCTVLTLTQI